MEASPQIRPHTASISSLSDIGSPLLPPSQMSVAVAPTGVITLVFTDIQGSTELWEQFRE